MAAAAFPDLGIRDRERRMPKLTALWGEDGCEMGAAPHRVDLAGTEERAEHRQALAECQCPWCIGMVRCGAVRCGAVRCGAVHVMRARADSEGIRGVFPIAYPPLV